MSPLRTSDFDYPLDAELIAQTACRQRDRSRLMRLDRADGAVSHHVFADLPNLLSPGDLLVVNDTRVIPAKFLCHRSTGGRIEGLFLHEMAPDCWEVMLKGAGKCRPGEQLTVAGGDGVCLCLLERMAAGRWLVEPSPPRPAVDVLENAGSTPLPPYIRRPDTSDDPADRSRYQTIYARQPGAVAAPTAGLHFTEEVFARLAASKMTTATVTLHVGAGTFSPVKDEDLSKHRMHSEWYDLPADTAEKVNAARQAGRRIVAVGTTSLRVLEAAAATADGRVQPGSGWTDLFIYPPGQFAVTDALVTNFHLPRSTLLMLVAAFCCPGGTGGLKMILAAYAEACRRRYRFYSYGDAMLIL